MVVDSDDEEADGMRVGGGESRRSEGAEEPRAGGSQSLATLPEGVRYGDAIGYLEA